MKWNFPTKENNTIFTNEINNEIWVTDLLGKIIVQTIYNQTTLNLAIAESGVYIVFLKTNEGISQKKLIVK